MISPDIRHTIRSHTEHMNPLERIRSAKELIRRYHITDPVDLDEVAEIADVPKDKLPYPTVTMQQRLT